MVITWLPVQPLSFLTRLRQIIVKGKDFTHPSLSVANARREMVVYIFLHIPLTMEHLRIFTYLFTFSFYLYLPQTSQNCRCKIVTKEANPFYPVAFLKNYLYIVFPYSEEQKRHRNNMHSSTSHSPYRRSWSWLLLPWRWCLRVCNM